jgi:hypothetical protein
MKSILLIALLFVGSSVLGQNVSAESFILSIQGQYRITQINGDKPKDANSLADIYADDTEGALTMPYCGADGICDPGYIFVSYQDAVVTETLLRSGVRRFRIDASGATYYWDELGAGQFRFINPSYQPLSGAPFELVHDLEKI